MRPSRAFWDALAFAAQDPNSDLLDVPRIYYHRALAYRANGAYGKAISDYSSAVRLKPDYANAYSNRAHIYLFLEKPSEAIKDYTQVIEITPQYDAAYDNRGVAYSATGQYNRAIEDWNRVLQLNRRFIRAFVERAWCHMQLGALADALTDLNHVIGEDTEKAEGTGFFSKFARWVPKLFADRSPEGEYYRYWALSLRGRLYQLQGQQTPSGKDYEKALEGLTRLVETMPDHLKGAPLLARARLYCWLENHTEAVKDFNGVSANAPKTFDDYLAWAYACEKLGRLDEAKVKRGAAARLNPSSCKP